MVGTGRSCQVWDSIDDQSHERRALKILVESYAAQRIQVSLLKREFAVGRGLDHPQVIHVYDYQNHRGTVYLVMELFPAHNIKQFFLQVGVEGLAHYVQQICEQSVAALDYLHGHGWVHRDVKPDNFLMNREGHVKLIDFALAERPKGALGRLFPSRMKIQGTRSYMSPEQIRGRGVDQRSDIYSLACMLHELVAGKPPFTGASTQELLTKHLRNPPPSLESAGRGVTTEFSELIRKMLSKNPAGRPPTMQDVAKALRGMKIYHRAPSPPTVEKSK
jgi:serine/threonine protein kinase